MNISKIILITAASAITLFSSCSNKEVLRNCRCCGGFTGGCWDETMVQANTEAQARAKCVAKGGNGADFNCDLN